MNITISMPSTVQLGPEDYENLAWVAQGQAFRLTDGCTQRLIAAGLVLRMEATAVSAASLQLTSAGLALIRSSDQ